jgi:hypothetical protein
MALVSGRFLMKAKVDHNNLEENDYGFDQF